MALDIASLVEVSDRISKNTAYLQHFLTTRGLPTPSFNVDTPTEFPNPDKERTVELVQEAVLADTRALFDLVIGPTDSLKWKVWQVIALAMKGSKIHRD